MQLLLLLKSKVEDNNEIVRNDLGIIRHLLTRRSVTSLKSEPIVLNRIRISRRKELSSP